MFTMSSLESLGSEGKMSIEGGGGKVVRTKFPACNYSKVGKCDDEEFITVHI